MKRGGPLRRYQDRRRRNYPLQSVPAAAKRPRHTGPTKATRELVWDRDDGCCVVCGHGITNGDYSLQHRRARGMGGSGRDDTNSPVNLIVVCGSATTGCHREIESNPAWALKLGYRVPQHANPAEVPVFIVGVGDVYLNADGTTAPFGGDAA